MTVKDRVGRRRYILFRQPADPPSRAAFGRALGERPWKLTVYEQGLGILRTPHTDVAQARALLEGLGAEPLRTSGTIKTLKRAAGLR